MTDTEWRPGVAADAPLIPCDVEIGELLVAIPCYGGAVLDGVLHGMLDLRQACTALGINMGYITTRNESLVQRARNRCVAEFIARPNATHLLFIDADIGFSARAVLRLIAHDVPLIGGLYRRKQLDRAEWVWNRLPPNQEKRNPKTGAVSCAAVGTGFMLIKREVIFRMIEASLETPSPDEPLRSRLRYLTAPTDGNPGGWRDHTYSLFDCWIDETGNYLSEDYAFCRRWRDLGGDVWADPAIQLEHIGTASFIGDPRAGV